MSVAKLSVHVKKYKARLLDAPQHACATLATLVHDETPRDTGDAQNSWKLIINGVDRSPQGGDFISASRSFKLGDDYMLLSSLPYIRRLEYGWSKQAPAGMLRVNTARWPDIVDFSVRQAGGG